LYVFVFPPFFPGWGKDLSTSFVHGVIMVLPLASCHAQQVITMHEEGP